MCVTIIKFYDSRTVAEVIKQNAGNS